MPTDGSKPPSSDEEIAGQKTFLNFLEGLPSDLVTPDPQSPRGRILCAARELFAEHGFEGTSTRAIAGEARVNQAMIHYYFGNKESLYRRVISLEILSVFRGISARLEKRGTPEEILIGLPTGLMNELRQDPVRAKLIRREIGQGASQARQAIAAMGEFGPQGFRQVLFSLVEEGQRRGKIRCLPPESVMPFLLTVAYGSLLLEPLFRAVLSESAEDEAVWDRRMQVFDALLRNGLMIEEIER